MDIKIKPEIFIPVEKHTLIEVLVEQHDNIDILWYHWPRDGWFRWVHDYEPVTIIYRRDCSICYLITRRHWNNQTYTLDEGLIFPPEVLFDGGGHPPFAKTDDKIDWFERKKRRLLHQQYPLRPIKPDDIPMMFRIGIGHPTAIGRTFKDPAVYAKEIYNDFCR